MRYVQERAPANKKMYEADVSVPSFSARLREKAIVELQNSSAKIP
jgi:hypothetical protein